MNTTSLATAARIGLAFLLAQGLVVEAAEVKVLCSSAIIPIMNGLVPRFERDTGHKLAIRYGAGPVMKRQIAGGEAVDVDALIKQGKVAAGSRAVLGHTGIGVGTRQGTPKSDVSTPDALVTWLPSELQTIVVFTGGVGSAAKEAEAGRALLDFLTTPAASAVFKANGLESGAR